MDDLGKQKLEKIEWKRINADIELVEILEELRKDTEKMSYGAWGNNLGYPLLTKLLARKIKAVGGLKKLRGTI